MTNLPGVPLAIPPMSPASVALVRAAESILFRYPQTALRTEHVFHAGTYARTVTFPAPGFFTGALIKIPTLLIVEGDVVIWIGERARRVTGYAVLPAAAGRKQLFRTISDTRVTMVFATQARTVDEAEREFTDEWETLASRRPDAVNVVTGE